MTSTRPDQSRVRLERISKQFAGQKVLDGISCELRESEVVLLRGANGAGKTTLVDILCGYCSPDFGRLEYFRDGERWSCEFPQPWWRQGFLSSFRPEVVARKGIARTWQDVRLLPNHTLIENVALATNPHPGENPVGVWLRPGAVRTQEESTSQAAIEALARFGLRGRERSSGDRLSLGESKRVAIARALATGARILVLDEPLSGLDGRGVAGIIELLAQLAREGRVTMLIIEHALNIPRLLPLATHVWTLTGGKLHVQTPVEVAVEMQAAQPHDLLTQLTANLDGIRVERQELTGEAQLTIITAGEPGPVVMEVDDVAVRRGQRLVIGDASHDGQITGLSFRLRAGQTGVIEAPNGWGKSSIMLAIAGLLPISQGSLRLMGQTIHLWPAWQRARLGLAMLQSRANSFPGLTARDVLRLSGSPSERLCELWGDKLVAELSGGERQKLSLACFASRRATLGLLDEPWAALDSEGLATALELMKPRPGQASLVSLPAAQ